MDSLEICYNIRQRNNDGRPKGWRRGCDKTKCVTKNKSFQVCTCNRINTVPNQSGGHLGYDQ